MFNNAPSPGFKWRKRLGIATDGKNNKWNPETKTATSYDWWDYYTEINGLGVFNEYPYSPSTQNHQRNFKKFAKENGIKIDVTVYMRQSLSKFWSESLPSQYEELFTIQVEGPRARKDGVYVECHSKHYDTRAEAVKAIKESIATCRQLGAKFTRDQIAALKKDVADRDASRLERARRDRAEVKAKQAALKPKLTDLGPISLDVFQKVNDLDEIDLNQNNKELSDVA
jgi:hypothetical protein